ncbi:MAG: hypothetical protein CL992_00885 [Euryarchaeota archaeon]|nr:hypothetical protein [Euryarchaeota archaeon]
MIGGMNMVEKEKNDSANIPRHAVPKGSRPQSQELLYDPNVATSTHAEQARTLASMKGTATLCTMSVNPDGFPYGSFVTFAIFNGNPIFLISVLAEHTKNLMKNPKASLLIAEGGDENPLALGRVTLVGECTLLPEEEQQDAREVFLEQHESAAFYVDFGDFSFYRLEVSHIRYIGGFGRMSWVESTDWLQAEPDPISPYGKGIIEHMNDDHRDAMVLMCKTMSKAVDTMDAEMTGVDRYGFEMSAITEDGPRPIRLAFENEVLDADDVRRELVDMVKIARNTTSVDD